MGFIFDRQAAGSHEIWYSEHTDRYTTVSNHPGDIPEGMLRAILKQAGIEPNDFLKKKIYAIKLIPEFCTQLALNGHRGQIFQNDEELVFYPIA